MGDEDPERLIAEALRAQASRTPLPDAEATQVRAAPGLGLAGSGYGLLSGSDLPLVPPPAPAPAGQATRRLEPDRRVSVLAILLLAAVLGLAAGAVAGLLTLL
ncbi:MAG TPA: hypothetical protein VGX25_30065 [Actinophytocola sp.]|uniref:hypothetical protein n=1 Tax=Actinophytocola sp. TaxID=1872138 RepID=UPI002DDD01BF|nr:hypothetical protein [Actinophytocola sp.]HEV2783653.1 hypothetical protein [Actinophytocola sp.]